MLVTSKEMLLNAQEGNYSVCNADFLDNDSAKTMCKCAEELNIPLILAYADSYCQVIDTEEIAVIGRYWAERVKTPICLHFDHGTSFETCKNAVDLGFTSVMIDASSKSFEENVAETKKVVEYAHERGVVVEAEIGHVGQNVDGNAEDNGTGANESVYTEVDAAVKFKKLTNVDSLAVSIGTSHGNYKGKPIINFERLHELKKAVSIPLVLHGGSSSGDVNLNRCATEGISKINIFTDFLNASTKAIKELNSEMYFDYKFAVNNAMKNVLIHYSKVFETKRNR